jgi:hypothetical protein
VSLLFSDLCRENPDSVGSDFGVVGIRDVNSITLPKLIDSKLESGLEIFSFSVLYLTVPPSSAN